MKNFKLILIVFVLSAIYSCVNQDDLINNEQADNSQRKLLSASEVNIKVISEFEEKGVFDWRTVSSQLLWSAVIHGDQILTIGYGKTNESFREEDSAHLAKIRADIIATIKETTTSKNEVEIVIYEDELLNYIDVKITNIASIIALRKNKNIRYMEPDGFVFTSLDKTYDKLTSSCGQSSEYISTSDYGTIASGARFPWNFYDHKINKAWAYSKGRGVGVGVIDTGVSLSQSHLGYKFDDYYSGRYIQKYGTYVDSWRWWATNTDGPNDPCGHGTSISAAIAGPNNNSNKFLGVAYECNLISYRGTGDVILNGYHERKGVANALKALGRRSDVKIISMSIGYPWSIGRVSDAVRYAYARNKLIFSAGGTSTNFATWYGVIFPATMSETVAVTGVEEQSSYNECDVCHIGNKIDFTVVMERGNNHHQPVLGYYNNGSRYFGGSSVATATTAGIAALVWAKYPWASRAQILQRLKESAHFYPNKNSDYGYGNINALRAVRGY